MPSPHVPAAVVPASAAPVDGADSSVAPLLAQDSQSLTLFQQSWQTYQKLLTTDFLEHRGLYAAVQACLRAHAAAAARPLALLDLGCGDAQQMAALLRACGCDSPHSPQGPLRLASYTGVDLSTPALALARANLAFLGAAAQLAVQDMQAFLAACPPRSYDLVFASFAVHHLSREGKAQFLRQAARALRPGGALVLVDIFLREGEQRPGWMQRFQAHMGGAVSDGIVEQREADTLLSHVTGHDYPEAPSTYADMAAAAGLAPPQWLHTDSKEFSRAVVLRAPPAAAAE